MNKYSKTWADQQTERQPSETAQWAVEVVRGVLTVFVLLLAFGITAGLA